MTNHHFCKLYPVSTKITLSSMIQYILATGDSTLLVLIHCSQYFSLLRPLNPLCIMNSKSNITIGQSNFGQLFMQNNPHL